MIIRQNWIDEVLEAVWVAKETNKDSIQDIKIICEHDAQETIDIDATVKEMVTQNLIKKDNGRVLFLPEGKRQAMNIIRRHRLAERLLVDVLQVSESSMEITACQFEHILNLEVTESVCAFLGHPPLCPHGHPIPLGSCCKAYQRDRVKPLVIRLIDVELGKDAKIAFITPSFHKRFERLTALGVIAGSHIVVHQRKPSFVVRLGETELAIDEDIAREIYVKPL
ncbi:MAG: metal-dependent transcriptional regulator [Candidatus Marinimicrobia bacterium]|nr:metal-dependent transcriptional regulator [Candidatus Neomarinimicrobiota bacterium]